MFSKITFSDMDVQMFIFGSIHTSRFGCNYSSALFQSIEILSRAINFFQFE